MPCLPLSPTSVLPGRGGGKELDGVGVGGWPGLPFFLPRLTAPGLPHLPPPPGVSLGMEGAGAATALVLSWAKPGPPAHPPLLSGQRL